MNFATIGTGWIAGSFITAAREVENLKHTCVYSRNREKAVEFAEKYNATNVNIFTSLEEMAKSDKLDGVYIASPNSLHYEQSKLFLQNKKHVICEKPIAISGELVLDLIDTAKENGVIFMEAIKGSHLPQLELLKQATTRIGRISAASFDFCQLSSKYDALKKADLHEGDMPNIFNPIFKTGAAMDIGIYCVYPALELFGAYESLTAMALKHKNGIDLCGSAILGYADKAITLTYSKIGEGRGISEIIGDEGTITIDKLSNFDGITLHNKDGSKEVIQTAANDGLNMRFEAQHFYDYATDYEKNAAEHKRLNALSVQVTDTLQKIRKACGMAF